MQPAAYGPYKSINIPSTSAQPCDNIGVIINKRQVLAMNAIELLERPRKLWSVIDNCIQELNELKQGGLCGHGYQERVQQSRNIHKMDDLLIRQEDLKLEIATRALEYVDAAERFRNYVFQLDGPCVDVLIEKYFHRYSFKEIAKMKQKNYAYITQLHRRGIKALQEILDRENAV